MDLDLCKERHERIDKRLDNHSDRLKKLENHKAKSEEKFDSLCDKLDSLVITIRWAMGTIAGALIGFFIWYVQKL